MSNGGGVRCVIVLLLAGLALSCCAETDEPLFKVYKPLDITAELVVPGDYVIHDLTAFKLSADGLTQAPASVPKGQENLWVGGVWGKYGDALTKTDYITSKEGMDCGPDVDLFASGTGYELLSGTGGEGVWEFWSYQQYYISDSSYYSWYSPLAVLTALKPITINSNGVTTFVNTGETYTEGDYAMLIREAKPPVAVASTTTPVIPAGGTATLDGSESYVGNPAATKIVSYEWTFKNLADESSFTVKTPDATLSQSIPVAGDYLVVLKVTDDLGLVGGGMSTNHLNITAVGVTFSPTALTLTKGTTGLLVATIVPDHATSLVSFSSEQPTIAKVSPLTITNSTGTIHVTGVDAGETTVNATLAGGATAGSAEITVTDLDILTLELLSISDGATLNGNTVTKLGSILRYSATTPRKQDKLSITVTDPAGKKTTKTEEYATSLTMKFTADLLGIYTIEAAGGNAVPPSPLSIEVRTATAGPQPAADIFINPYDLNIVKSDGKYYLEPGKSVPFRTKDEVDNDLDWDGVLRPDTFKKSDAFQWSGTTGLTEKTGSSTTWNSGSDFTSVVTITLTINDDGVLVKDAGGPFKAATVDIYPIKLKGVDVSPSSRTQWSPPGVSWTATATFEQSSGPYPALTYYLFDASSTNTVDKAVEPNGAPHTFTIPAPGSYMVGVQVGSQSTLSKTVTFFDDFKIVCAPNPIVFDYNPGVVAGKPETFIKRYKSLIRLAGSAFLQAAPLRKVFRREKTKVESLKAEAEAALKANGGKPLSGFDRLRKGVRYFTALNQISQGMDALNKLLHSEADAIAELKKVQVEIENRPASITRTFTVTVNRSGTFPYSVAVDNTQTKWRTNSHGYLSIKNPSGTMSSSTVITVTSDGNLGTGKLKVVVAGRTKYIGFEVKGLTKSQALDTWNAGATEIQKIRDKTLEYTTEVALGFGALSTWLNGIAGVMALLFAGFIFLPFLAEILAAFALSFAFMAAFASGAAIVAWLTTDFIEWLGRDSTTDAIRDTYSE